MCKFSGPYEDWQGRIRFLLGLNLALGKLKIRIQAYPMGRLEPVRTWEGGGLLGEAEILEGRGDCCREG